MSNVNHAEWLSLIDVSGPFLSVPVLDKVFPQGLEVIEPATASRVRSAYEEWRESRDGTLHHAWIEFILAEVLEYESRVLKTGADISAALQHTVAEHGVELRPSAVLVEPNDPSKARLLIAEWPSTQKDLQQAATVDFWAASPADHMTELCRATGVRLGLVTNGEQWVLVDAPHGETPAYVTWYASLWTEERVTLQAFRSLLGVRRFFASAEDETLEHMLADSVQYQAEVTDQLGAQVRRAVEVLIQALDKADADAGRKLLRDIPESVLYEASITVMMRLVFLFCAEERDLLLLGDSVYDQHYAVSTLRSILREEADEHGIEVLERRQDAWSRLLAAFRGIYGGIDHESLRLPAYGGSLFDPDRFPFLEGREQGTSWQEDVASPLPVDNRTVLHLLEALQLLQMRGRGGAVEARKLSFRALDIEQIGHVYEGLLDHTAVRAEVPTLGLVGKLGEEPEVSLRELEEKWMAGDDVLLDYLHNETGKSKSALRKLMAREVESEWGDQLKRECGDSEFYQRVEPFHALVREDPWGDPIVMCPGDVYVTAGTDRRSSGTHYTPKALTEEIVRYTLEPLAYVGPAEGNPREEWELRPSAELLDLKICDPAMGSGAFLVQVVRWLAERIVEAWDAEQAEETQVESRDERVMHARRLVAERCVYGVDINPLAVEMGKLSLWLVTLSKGRPFGFLDHALKCGDSLLGVHDLDQICYFHPDPTVGKKRKLTLFNPAPLIEAAIEESERLRTELESFEVLDVRDAQQKAVLLAEAAEATATVRVIADVVTCAALTTASESASALDTRLRAFESQLGEGAQAWVSIGLESRQLLDAGAPAGNGRRPFHWPLEFPEVFGRHGGFDAICMNPPFLGGRRISGVAGEDYRAYVVRWVARSQRGSADLSSYFLLRAAQLLNHAAIIGTLATNSISESETRRVGLEQLMSDGLSVVNAWKSRPWPGSAAVEIALLWVRRGAWAGERHLDGLSVHAIDAGLRSSDIGAEGLAPERLAANRGRSFQGSIVLGMGFTLTPGDAQDLASKHPQCGEVLKPYLNGEDLVQSIDQMPTRWVIDFGERTEDEARRYAACWEIVEKRVRPDRCPSDPEECEAKRRKYPRMVDEWWKFWNARPALYSAIRGLDSVIVLSRVGKAVMPSVVPNGYVYSDRLVVFAFNDMAVLALLSSSIHRMWALANGSTLETRPIYNPTGCFETFPMPTGLGELSDLGCRLVALRRCLMTDRAIGLTNLYSLLADCSDNDITELRTLHQAIDAEVLRLYGWMDLSPVYAAVEFPWGREWAIDPATRAEVVHRLLELNHERYAEEVALGLHDKGAKKTKKRAAPSDTQSLF